VEFFSAAEIYATKESIDRPFNFLFGERYNARPRVASSSCHCAPPLALALAKEARQAGKGVRLFAPSG
jgi:hypothetical protein